MSSVIISGWICAQTTLSYRKSMVAMASLTIFVNNYITHKHEGISAGNCEHLFEREYVRQNMHAHMPKLGMMYSLLE